MKQNSQWLSHVRTWSNRAASTSRPNGSPFGRVTVLGRVGEQLILDDITGNLAAHGENLVARKQSGPGGWRPWGHRHHARQWHRVSQSNRWTAITLVGMDV